jgi:hypothetical protein
VRFCSCHTSFLLLATSLVSPEWCCKRWSITASQWTRTKLVVTHPAHRYVVGGGRRNRARVPQQWPSFAAGGERWGAAGIDLSIPGDWAAPGTPSVEQQRAAQAGSAGLSTTIDNITGHRPLAAAADVPLRAYLPPCARRHWPWLGVAAAAAEAAAAAATSSRNSGHRVRGKDTDATCTEPIVSVGAFVE